MELGKFMRIEPVGQSGRRCGVCPLRPRTEAAAAGTLAFMHYNVFRELADKLAPPAELHFQGLSDPLLHLHLFDMVRHAAARGIRVSVYSDLTVLTESRAEECAGSGLHRMHVWMDGASAEVYAAIRGRSCFDRVRRNLRRLMQARRSLDSAMQVQLMMPAARGNLHEIPALVQLAHDEGIGALTVQHVCHASCGPAEADSAAHEQSLQLEDPRRIEHYFGVARSLAASLGVALALPAMRRRHRHQARVNGRRCCDQPWRGSYIGFDGQPVASCMGGMAIDAGLDLHMQTTAGQAVPQQEIRCGD